MLKKVLILDTLENKFQHEMGITHWLRRETGNQTPSAIKRECGICATAEPLAPNKKKKQYSKNQK